MKKYWMAILSLSMLWGVTACNSGNNDGVSEADENEAVVAADSTLSDDRKELLGFSARHIMLEKEFATLAQQKAQTDSLKAYAQDLGTWADSKQKELQELNSQYGLTLPQQLSDEENDYLEDVREADADKFDEKLWDKIVKAQKDAIDHLDDELKDVDVTDASAFALWERNTLKELRAHMEQAAAYKLELKNREGGISKPIREEIGN